LNVRGGGDEAEEDDRECDFAFGVDGVFGNAGMGEVGWKWNWEWSALLLLLTGSPSSSSSIVMFAGGAGKMEEVLL
jgi:hypothetical protein